MISTELLSGKAGRVPARKVFYRIDENGRPIRCVHGPQLAKLLSIWGVWNPRGSGYWSKTKTGQAGSIRMLGLSELRDLYDRAKSAYKKQISKAHTDHGGDNELATVLNCAWDNTERLFRKRGLEI